MTATHRTALVTGANSGLGFQAAGRFAELGYDRVILATRSQAKGDDTRRRLAERTGRDPFETLTVDVTAPDVIRAAVRQLAKGGGKIDALLLNAGVLGGAELHHATTGIERTMAASVTGHHQLTMGLLAEGLLSAEARIVIAGSEAARGDMPMFTLTDVPAFADRHFAGDRSAAVAAIARAEAPHTYSGMPQYATVKLVSAWWALALGERLPEGMAVYCVSPGSAPDTAAIRHQNWFMRNIATPIMTGPIGRAMGMSQSVADAAERYLDAMSWGTERSGQFWASKPGKAVGPVERMVQPASVDTETAAAAWRAIVGLTDADVPTGAALREASA
jgi:NAD(P)-dependent dehydrogenase (short-subunit alcohol dehydrogenase family)